MKAVTLTICSSGTSAQKEAHGVWLTRPEDMQSTSVCPHPALHAAVEVTEISARRLLCPHDHGWERWARLQGRHGPRCEARADMSSDLGQTAFLLGCVWRTKLYGPSWF